jgi:hypothetical protein
MRRNFTLSMIASAALALTAMTVNAQDAGNPWHLTASENGVEVAFYNTEVITGMEVSAQTVTVALANGKTFPHPVATTTFGFDPRAEGTGTANINFWTKYLNLIFLAVVGLSILVLLLFVIRAISKRCKGLDHKVSKMNLPILGIVSLLCIFGILKLFDDGKDIFEAKNVTIVPHIEAGILMITAFMTFLAFYIQYQFNSKQKYDIDDERIENKFFHFLDNLREISRDIKVKNIGSNKRAFHFIFYEVKTLTYLLYIFCSEKLRSVDDNELLFPSVSLIDDKLKKSLPFISLSFVLSGATGTSNKQIQKRINCVFGKNDIDIKTSSFINQYFEDIVLIVNCLQEIHNSELEKFSDMDCLTLFLNFWDRQTLNNEKMPWFWGRRPEMVSYIKYLAMIINFICSSNRKNIKDSLYMDTVFSQLSEYEIGLMNIFVCSYHELPYILGVVDSDTEYQDIEQIKKICTKNDKYMRFKDIIKSWISQTNSMYNFTTWSFNIKESEREMISSILTGILNEGYDYIKNNPTGKN